MEKKHNGDRVGQDDPYRPGEPRERERQAPGRPGQGDPDDPTRRRIDDPDRPGQGRPIEEPEDEQDYDEQR